MTIFVPVYCSPTNLSFRIFVAIFCASCGLPGCRSPKRRARFMHIERPPDLCNAMEIDQTISGSASLAHCLSARSAVRVSFEQMKFRPEFNYGPDDDCHKTVKRHKRSASVERRSFVEAKFVRMQRPARHNFGSRSWRSAYCTRTPIAIIMYRDYRSAAHSFAKRHRFQSVCSATSALGPAIR